MTTSVIAAPTYATGDTIEAQIVNLLRDNDLVLDARTGGDPGVANKMLVSSGSLGAYWAVGLPANFVDNQALGANVVDARVLAADSVGASEIVAGAVGLAELAAGAVVAHLGYTPVNKAGDTMTANLLFSVAGLGIVLGAGGKLRDAAGNTVLVANGDTLLVNNEAESTSMLVLTPSALQYMGGNVWHAGNDHNHPAGFTFANGGKIRDNVTGTIISANNDVLNINNEADSATMLAVTQAAFNWMGNVVYHAGNIASATAGNASALGGLGPTSYARLASSNNFTVRPTFLGETPIDTSNILAQSVAFASTAGNAATADTSGQLGGVVAASYARKDAASNFTVTPTIGGNAIVHAATTGWAGQSGDSLALGGIAAAFWARQNALANFTAGLQVSGNAVVHAGNIATQSVDTAATSGNSLALGSVSASGYPRRASGNYTGNNTAGRQIATGFPTLQFMIQSDGSAFTFFSLNTTRALAVSGSSNAATTGVHLHATDGFVVGANANEANGSADTYHWVALG